MQAVLNRRASLDHIRIIGADIHVERSHQRQLDGAPHAKPDAGQPFVR